MLDIVETEDGKDLGLADTVVARAANVVGTQLGTLEYAPDFGVDLKYFLESELQFQNASFKAYLIQRLTEHQINVAGVIDELEALLERLTFSVGNQSQSVKGYIK